LVNTVKNKESEEEPVQVSKENVLRLSCHIDNNNNPINHLAEGLKISLEGDIEKHSDFLGRNSVWFKQAKVNKLVIYFLLVILNLAKLLNHSLCEILLEERKLIRWH
jgi:ubiquitin carboxyl-terminal hydrolase 14